jgi:hypothetical protein
LTLNRKRTDDPELDGGSVTERARPAHPVRSFIVFLLFMAGALLVFGVLAARTAGFREIVSVKNQQWTQTRVRIGGSRISWPYDLVLTDVILPDANGKDTQSLAIPLVRVQWRPGRGVDVMMEGPKVRLVEHEDGGIEPEELALLGRIRNEADVTEWLAPVRARAALHVTGGILEVVAPAGAAIRRLDTIRLEATPAVIPGRTAEHFRLEGLGTSGELVRDWLWVDGTGVVELDSGARTNAARGRDFWKGIQP